MMDLVHREDLKKDVGGEVKFVDDRKQARNFGA
jgi:hypothetical protein